MESGLLFNVYYASILKIDMGKNEKLEGKIFIND